MEMESLKGGFFLVVRGLVIPQGNRKRSGYRLSRLWENSGKQSEKKKKKHSKGVAG